MESEKDHPLTTPRILAALAVAGVFWTAGIAMIDQREVVAIPLCFIGIGATLWIFWPSLKANPFTERKSRMGLVF
jgi:cbb3-type cytochrome oxidase subunit 3